MPPITATTRAKDVAGTYDDDQDYRQQAHVDRLHRELRYLPCSERCANWLQYGIQPKDAGPELVPGFCDRQAHRREHLGLGAGACWLRAIRVRDLVELLMPMLVVQVAEPKGVDVKAPKSGRARRVPVADRVLPLVRAMTTGKAGGDRLFVSKSGHQLHASALKRTTHWASVADGRRIHDLRHTAACLWLAKASTP